MGDELRVRVVEGGDVRYRDDTGLEACLSAMMAELGPSCVDIEYEIVSQAGSDHE
jgi:hypothetical protein